MSPFVLVRNVPYTAASLGGPSEEDSDEWAGTATCGGVGASGQRGVEAGAGGGSVGDQLPAGEADLAALPRRMGGGSGASPRRPGVEPRPSGGIAAPGVVPGAGEVFGRSGRTLRANAGGRALGRGRRRGDARRDAAALDAGGGVVESGAEADVVSEAASAPG